ncbi:MAG TPA: hypothetical protein VK480_08980, partial [Solirubrobacterales bacterium]|nr:hypothetical protein [Solirubrobacterales bacterium]
MKLGVDPGDVAQLAFGGVVEEAVVELDDQSLDRLRHHAHPLAVEEGEVVAVEVAEVAVPAVGPAQGGGVVRVPAPLFEVEVAGEGLDVEDRRVAELPQPRHLPQPPQDALQQPRPAQHRVAFAPG